MRPARLAILVLPLLAALAALGVSPAPAGETHAGALIAGPRTQAPAIRCEAPSPAPLHLAQGVILCCCVDAQTKGQCCNYVAGSACGRIIPGCGCE